MEVKQSSQKKMGGMLLKAKRTGVLEKEVDSMDAMAAAAAAADAPTLPAMDDAAATAAAVAPTIPAPTLPTPPSTFIITSPSSRSACVLTNLGATMMSFFAPATIAGADVPFVAATECGRGSNYVDICLGYDSAAEWASDVPYFGPVVGRVCNRIKEGKLILPNGFSSQLAINNGPNHLHGGIVGWSKRLWTASDVGPHSVTFTLTSGDGDEGFPGEVLASATYTMLDGGDDSCATSSTLRLTMEASLSPESPDGTLSPVNMTNHAYFNLCGGGVGGGGGGGVGSSSMSAPCGVLDHSIQMFADSYLPVDANMIPTRVVAPLDGSPEMDFRSPRTLRSAVESLALKAGGSKLSIDAMLDKRAGGKGLDGNDEPIGIDHTYVLSGRGASSSSSSSSSSAPSTSPAVLVPAATLRHEESGRRLSLLTNAPGVQCYTGNWLSVKGGKGGRTYGQWDGVCFETQHFPDAIDRLENAEFGKGATVLLGRGGGREFGGAAIDKYEHIVEYVFSNDK